MEQRQNREADENQEAKDRREIKERRQSSGKAERRDKKSQPKYETINWKDKKEKTQGQDDKRGDFARKYKGAFTYYHK